MALELTSSFAVLDARFRKLALPYIHVEKLYTGCRWAEGPAWFPAGRYLVWSDIPNDRMLRWDETDGSVSVFRQPALNSNGHTVDLQGRLVSCEHRSRSVSRTEHDGTRTVLASHFEDKRFNSPNDVVVKSDGSVWFSDPSYRIDSDYEGDASPSEIGAQRVYRIAPRAVFSRRRQWVAFRRRSVRHLPGGTLRRSARRRARQPLVERRRRRALPRSGRGFARQSADSRGGREPVLRRHQAQLHVHLRHDFLVCRLSQHTRGALKDEMNTARRFLRPDPEEALRRPGRLFLPLILNAARFDRPPPRSQPR